MRNIFLFIARYSTFFLFLVLQIIALIMLFRYNRFHEAAYMNMAQEMTGKFYVRYNTIETYFSLKEENEKLRLQNTQLLNQLKADFARPDTAVLSEISRFDTIAANRKYFYLSAKIIGNSVSAQNNFITLHRGSAQGIEPNMAVVGPSGIIGKIVNVSPNMSIVMSLLHRKNNVVAVMKKGGGFGEVTWNGKDPRFVQLSNIPRTITIVKGDTVVTSSYSDIFPAGYTIGFVEQVKDDKSSSTYTVEVRTATNFFQVQHAYVVQNLQKAELDSLQKKIKRD
ncbi:MAG: rod shape-determining protein MreC [Sphingobacteriales bacterium]|jgi:rod shape-determining protein MreC